MKAYLAFLVCIGFFFGVFWLLLFTLATISVVFLGIENLSPTQAYVSLVGIISVDFMLTYLLLRRLDR